MIDHTSEKVKAMTDKVHADYKKEIANGTCYYCAERKMHGCVYCERCVDALAFTWFDDELAADGCAPARRFSENLFPIIRFFFRHGTTPHRWLEYAENNQIRKGK